MSAMREVTKDEFFARLNAERRDVHPRIMNDRWPYQVEWEFHREPGRPLFGRSFGAETHDVPGRYFLRDAK